MLALVSSGLSRSFEKFFMKTLCGWSAIKAGRVTLLEDGSDRPINLVNLCHCHALETQNSELYNHPIYVKIPGSPSPRSCYGRREGTGAETLPPSCSCFSNRLSSSISACSPFALPPKKLRPELEDAPSLAVGNPSSCTNH